MGVDDGSFGDEQSTRSAGALVIILEAKISVGVFLVRPEPRHRTENDTMLEVHTTDTDGLEELRCHRHLKISRCEEVVDTGKLKESKMGHLLDFLYTGSCAMIFDFHSIPLRRSLLCQRRPSRSVIRS